jgi:hypothetical protein
MQIEGIVRMSARRMLTWVLRAAGVAMLGGLIFVFYPFEWMAATHEWLGLGELAYTPLTSYLARTLSALYATIGAILVFLSLDVERYLPLIRFFGILAILGGAGVTILDAILRLPLFWTLSEGPLTVALGLAIIILTRMIRREPR